MLPKLLLLLQIPRAQLLDSSLTVVVLPALLLVLIQIQFVLRCAHPDATALWGKSLMKKVIPVFLRTNALVSCIRHL